MLCYGTSWIASSLVKRSLMISKRQSEAVNLKDRQYNLKKTAGQTMFYKALHRKLEIEQQEPH
jgi:hypothetical protein